MDFITKCNELKKMEFKSQEWVTAYTSLVKEVYNMDKLYVILNPKKIDYDYEVGIPYITKVKMGQEDTVIALLFSDRIHADAWINKYGNGKNFVGLLQKEQFNDFFAKCVLFKVNMCNLNEGNDSFLFGNADMVTMNSIPTQVKVTMPKEYQGKDKVALKDLNIDFEPVPVNGNLCANEDVRKLELVEHIDIKVGVLTKNDSAFVNNKVHIFLGGQAVGNWMAKHKKVAKEYELKEDTVGNLAYLAAKTPGSKGLIVDGLAPFSLFADQIELSKIRTSLVTYTVFGKKSRGEITSAQALEMLMDEEFYVLKDENEDCGFDAMIRENDKGSFKAIQIYGTAESAGKINMAEHEVSKEKMADIMANAKGYGLIYEPYSHSWVEIEPKQD